MALLFGDLRRICAVHADRLHAQWKVAFSEKTILVVNREWREPIGWRGSLFETILRLRARANLLWSWRLSSLSRHKLVTGWT